MTAYFNLLTLFYLLATIVGVITAIILWFFPAKEHKSRKILSIIFLVLSANMLTGFIIESKLIYNIPGIYQFHDLLCFTFMPLAYLYVRSIVEQRFPSDSDMVHFIPLALLIVNYVPFLNLTLEQKLALINMKLIGQTVDTSIEQGSLLTADMNIAVHHILFCIYWFLQIWLILKLFRYGDEDVKKNNSQMMTWLLFFLCIQFFFYYPYFILLNSPGDFVLYKNIGIPSGIAALILSSAYLFMRPELLYGLSKMLVPVAHTSDNAHMVETLKPRHTSKFLSETKIIEIKEKLNEHLEQHSPYLNHGYNLKDMAEDLDTPLYILSSYINKEKGMNFNDFLNKYRVEHCIQKIERGEWKNVTLEGLAYDSGFNNRNSFTSAFKKFSGKTPSDYLKKFK